MGNGEEENGRRASERERRAREKRETRWQHLRDTEPRVGMQAYHAKQMQKRDKVK